MSRARCASVAIVVCCASAAPLSAQLTVGTALRASSVDALGRGRGHANQVVGAALRFERSWLALASDGAVLRDERGTWRTAGSLEGAVLTTTPLGGRLAVVGSLGEPARDSMRHGSRLAGGARLSRRIGAGGTWLAVDVVRAATPDAPVATELTSGAWRQIGSALLTVSLGSRARAARGWAHTTRVVTLPDSMGLDSLGNPVSISRQRIEQDSSSTMMSRQWSEAEGRLFWSAGRWSLDVAVRGRLGGAGGGAAMSAAADGAVVVRPRLAIVGGVGTSPGAFSSGLAVHRYASLGLRLMRAGPLARPLPVELQPVAVGFEVRRIEAGQYRVALRVPRARVVELTGDFTAWKPVALHRARGDWWEVTLPITPGTHQVNVRINGERWVAPPGATVVDDDFAGVVGVIVVR